MKRYLKAICTLIFTLLFLVPVLLILLKSSFSEIMEIVKSSYYRRVMGFSVYQALISTILSMIAGLPGAWLLANTDFRFKKTVKSIYSIPFVLPSVLVVLGFVIFYGNNGLLSRVIGNQMHILYSFKAVMMAHVFYNFPVFITIVGNAMEKLDTRIEESARNSGADELKIFMQITVPRLIKSVLSACCVVFMLCLSSFAIILILGGNSEFSTMEVEIYKLAKLDMNISKAASLCLYSILIASAVLFLQNTLSRNTIYTEEPIHRTLKLRKLPKGLFCLSSVYLILSVLFILCPVISIVIRSFTSSTSRAGNLIFSVNAYRYIDMNALSQTFLIAISSAFISTFLALGLVDCKGFITVLPLVVSSAIIGLGYLILSKYMSNLGSFFPIVLAHGVINMPFALKTLKDVHSKIPKQLSEIACLDGCLQSRYFLKVELPILKNSVISAFLLCFSLSAGELNATAILGSSKTATIPMQIKHLISSYNYQGACALGTVLVVLCFTVCYAGEKLKDRD